MWFTFLDYNAPGISRYDGKTFTCFEPADGLKSGWTTGILQDQTGYIWINNWRSGISRYDGKTFMTFSSEQGLGGKAVHQIYQDRNGHLWFCTLGGGLSHYDGKIVQVLTKKDGLPSNTVYHIQEDDAGNYWIATTEGVVRYRPQKTPPAVVIETVVADGRYEDMSKFEVPSTVNPVAFEFNSASLRTRPETMVYRYRLKGHDTGWKTTKARRVEYQDLSLGDYTFEVVAVDRDLVYSEQPAAVALIVHLPYERIGWMSALGIAVVLIAWQTGRIIQRDQGLQTANEELDESNRALSDANKKLFGLNQKLQQERSVERIRGEVQAMEK
ncbi:MAG: two-component regulator propeller domain-containing protein, partial [Candidatus Latescibacteria bacterium]|nr:two-component regulator propeller domain-containing protein [Candidatus Latescibacterota bacterium]